MLGPNVFVLYYAHLCMKCSLGISNFLEEISSLYLSFVSLYFFAFFHLRLSYLSLLFFRTLLRSLWKTSRDLFLTSSLLSNSPVPIFLASQYPQTQFSVLTQKDWCAVLGILLSAPWSRGCLQALNNHRVHFIFSPSLGHHNPLLLISNVWKLSLHIFCPPFKLFMVKRKFQN